MTLQGTVKNAVTGAPLPRALVQVTGMHGRSAALTDNEGHFEVPGVSAGDAGIEIARPGFHDRPPDHGFSAGVLDSAENQSHPVHVRAEMPDMVFELTPTSVVRGRVELSTGDSAEGIQVALLQRWIQHGRAVWRQVGFTRTNRDGFYRFAGLDAGIYIVFTPPELESNGIGYLIDSGSDTHIVRGGYPLTYFPDARSFQGAAKIQVPAGQETPANLVLTSEPFYAVRAAVVLPRQTQASFDANAMEYTPSVLDEQGHELRYPAQYDSATHTIQAMLPNGSYILRVSARNSSMPIGIPSPGQRSAALVIAGQAEVAVADHPVTNIRIALTPEISSSLQVTVMRGGTQTASPGTRPEVFIEAEQAGEQTDAMSVAYAQGAAPATLETTSLSPGAYWLHASVAQAGLCESSFTSGGANLAREPLMVAAGGTTAPLNLTLRDDCASLKLSLPGSISAPPSGEDEKYTVYLLPDFDTTADVTPRALSLLSGGTSTFQNLTPGNYHVYTLSAPVILEYRDPAALAALPNPGQTVTLEPGVTSNLVVEVPAQP